MFFMLNHLKAQQEIDTARIFTSLEEAFLHPTEVYKLKLHKLLHHRLPDTLVVFSNLRWLDISKNKLKEIPASIGKLENLEYLNASKNKLRSVPYTLGYLKKLKILVLNQNEIETLPKEIGNLSSLQVLDLWSNEIDQFPESISQLHQLKKVDLRGININEQAQERIKKQLPKAQLLFSGGCNCGK
jgi:Leucine-rich repeat (LRR) protein